MGLCVETRIQVNKNNLAETSVVFFLYGLGHSTSTLIYLLNRKVGGVSDDRQLNVGGLHGQVELPPDLPGLNRE